MHTPTFSGKTVAGMLASIFIIIILICGLTLPGQAQSSQPPVETVAEKLNHPVGIDVAPDGKVYFTEFGLNGALKVLIPGQGKIETAIPNLVSAAGVAVGPEGKVYVVETAEGKVWSYDPETGRADVVTEAKGIWGIDLDAEGNIYLTVRSKDEGKVLKIPAGGGQPETLIEGLTLPYGLDVASNGDIYIAEFGELASPTGTIKVWRAASGKLETLASNLANPYDVAVAQDGTVYFTVKAGKVYIIREGEVKLFVEGFMRLYGIALTSDGSTLYLAEFGSPAGVSGREGDGTIRKITLVPPITEQLKESLESLEEAVSSLSMMVWLAVVVSIVSLAVSLTVLALAMKMAKSGRPVETRRKGRR